MNTVKFYVNESELRSANVPRSNAETHMRANDQWSNEAFLLLSFIEAEGIPQTITDEDGDKWTLTNESAEGTTDVYTYTFTRSLVGVVVFVPSENCSGVISKIHEDGDFRIDFEDGEEGNYSPSEVRF